jgi:HD superfamily phosphohydrolase
MSSEFHVIKDPVHGTMQLNSQEYRWLKPFINSPDFQRLRNIKQLGLGDLVFPGAVHTRFNHCLGCSYLGGRIAKTLNISLEEQQIVMIACLLHDIGHGPFSHTFEDLFLEKAICHEEWTPLFLLQYREQTFLEGYNALNPEMPLSVEKLDEIERIIMHQGASNTLVADIVTSQLDADRLDYLLRDSHFCGVRYGEYDLQWMLHCLTAVQTKAGTRLGITRKGVGVAEHYLMARRLMMKNIYHHQKKFAIERLLIHFLQLFSEELAHNKFLSPYSHSFLGKYLLKVRQFNESIQFAKATEKQKRKFMQDNFSLYRNLCDYDVLQLIKQMAQFESDEDIYQLARRVHHRELPVVISLTDEQYLHAKKLVPAFHAQETEVRSWQLELLKIPHRSYTRNEAPILVTSEQGTKPLEELSMMIHSLSDRFENGCFVLIDRKIVEGDDIQAFIQALLQCASVNFQELFKSES